MAQEAMKLESMARSPKPIDSAHMILFNKGFQPISKTMTSTDGQFKVIANDRETGDKGKAVFFQ